MLHITQRYPKILDYITQDMKVYSEFDQLALIKARIVKKTKTMCKTFVQDVEIQTFISDKDSLTIEELQ